MNNPSENLEVWRAGQVRALCVFSKERISYKAKVTATMSWNDIPTCKEQGVDVQLPDAARHVPAGEGRRRSRPRSTWTSSRRSPRPPEYKDYMEKQALKPVFLTGPDMLKFLEEDDALNKGLMTEAGFVAQ